MSTPATKIRGIAFNCEMLEAIVVDRKTQTRRVASVRSGVNLDKCPQKIGDVLYVKEALQNIGGFVAYRFDDAGVFQDGAAMPTPWKWKPKKLPAMSMPRWAARHFIEITNVRVEKLQGISETDAIAEGCEGTYSAAYVAGGEIAGPDGVTPVEEFEELWRSINGDSSWESDPWVWVYEFRRTRI